MDTDNMNIAVLSGKGGTGKTLVSVNLAAAAKRSHYIDCDVEEPNGYLFFKPDNFQTEEISVKIPFVNNDLCNGCGKCVNFCKFNALAHIRKKLIVFEEICHSCGGCIMICPQEALAEKNKTIGVIQNGFSDQVKVSSGMLNLGESSGVPIIKKLIAENQRFNNLMAFIDCPPGSACIVMESIKDADFCVIVAEPTIFGVHNLNMIYELVKLFDKPFGVVLNKCIDSENPSEKFCHDNNIKILSKIPFDSDLGNINSNAKIAVREKDKYNKMFASLLENIKKEVKEA